MMKKFFFMLAATVALASCSNEEFVEPLSEVDDSITFRAYVEHSKDSRAVETTQTNLSAFYVTAFEDLNPDSEDHYYAPFFKDLLFKKENGVYVSNPVYQWSNKLSLQFFAYAYTPRDSKAGMALPYPESDIYGEVEITTDQQTMNNFSPAPKIEDQIDLVTAVAASKKTALNASVSLGFRHVLSEVAVRAKCDSKAHQILVKGVKFGNIICEGDYSFVSNNGKHWTPHSNDITTYEIIYSEYYDAQHSVKQLDTNEIDISLAEKKEVGYPMLIPQTLTSWSLTNESFGTPADGSGKSQTSAQYMALLIKITALDPTTGEPIENGGLKFPLKDEHKVEGTDGFGWAYIPFYVEKCSEWNMGSRYVYHLDFSRGAGYNEDGDPILDADIQFTASVGEWTQIDIYKPGDNVSISGSESGE